MSRKRVNIIGAGLAGAEAAYQLAVRGIPVTLYEQKPIVMSPAHSYEGFGELVCSNSLRSDRLANAAGLLKEEMRRIGSLIMEAAEATKVPAGGALAVNRYEFADYITNWLMKHPLVAVAQGEVVKIPEAPDAITIIATGPLTSDTLAERINTLIGEDYLHFFDAAAPIVMGDSIDMTRVFAGARYGRGEDDYLNCPMTKEEYDAFYHELIHAECVEQKEFEGESVFEGCMPVEVMGKRGYQTLLFGPMKPVGFTLEDGSTPYALVQLRKEDVDGRMYNLVGFQTHLKFPEQKRVFSMIPGLEQAEFARLGVMHKNTYINGPKLLDDCYRLSHSPHIYFAGQITGVEGYIESAASGLYAGLSAAYEIKGEAFPKLTDKTAIGALANYVANSATSDYQPMNITFGLMAEPSGRFRKRLEKRTHIAGRALEEIDEYVKRIEEYKQS